MVKFKTLATVRLYCGHIVLDGKQADRRAACLKKIKSGMYEIEKPVEFKAGEVIGLADAPKPYRNLLEEVGAKKPDQTGLKTDDAE